jgi:hypothetical protein
MDKWCKDLCSCKRLSWTKFWARRKRKRNQPMNGVGCTFFFWYPQPATIYRLSSLLFSPCPSIHCNSSLHDGRCLLVRSIHIVVVFFFHMHRLVFCFLNGSRGIVGIYEPLYKKTREDHKTRKTRCKVSRYWTSIDIRFKKFLLL